MIKTVMEFSLSALFEELNQIILDDDLNDEETLGALIGHIEREERYVKECSESITREVAEERLDNTYVSGPASPEYILNKLFPPNFIPKKGEVIAVWEGNDKGRLRHRVFIAMEERGYECINEVNPSTSEYWDFARPHTPKEKGE